MHGSLLKMALFRFLSLMLSGILSGAIGDQHPVSLDNIIAL